MAWSAPFTAVANATFTAAQFNQYVRDNLLETAAAKATTAGRIFVATGANALAERAISTDTVATGQTTTSTTFADLATVGPAVTVTTGANALVFESSQITNSTLGAQNIAAVAISGATTLAANDDWCVFAEAGAANDLYRVGVTHLFTSLTPGSNTFTMKYRTTAGTATFTRRTLVVIAL